jgi:hypothetical protein
MPSTRSGRTKYNVGPEHQGRYAVANRTFASNRRREEPGQRRRDTRFQTTQRQGKRIKLAEPSPPTPTKEEIIKLERARRGANPTCLHYGVEKDVREYLYPNHFFCGHCDDYVEAMIHSMNKKAIKRDSRAFICQGGHTNFIAPTTLKEEKLHFRMFSETPEADDVLVERESTPILNRRFPHTATATATTETTCTVSVTPAASEATAAAAASSSLANDVALRNLQKDYQSLVGQDSRKAKQLELLEAKLSELSDKLLEENRQLRQKYSDLLQSHQRLSLKTMDAKGLVLRAINLPFEDREEFDGSDAVVTDTKIQKQKKLCLFVTMLAQSQFMDGLVRNEILKQSKKIIREEEYTPWKILRLKDRHGEKLSLDSIDILPTLETKDKAYVRDTILCGSATIKRVAKIVESFANSFIPYHISSLAPEHGKGEVIEFDLEKVLPVVLRATDLYEAAKTRRVEVPQSSDATNITKNVSFIIYGIKIKDRAAVCPITKRPLYIPAENGESSQTFVQSFENCIPVKIIIGKETKEVVYAQLKENFEKLAKEDGLSDDDPSSLLGEGFKPLISPCNADKKMHWAGLGTGGAAKVYKLPCTCCAVKSDDLAVANSTLCERWCQQWQREGKLADYPHWRCYHKPMVTPERIAEIREQADSIQLQLGDLADRVDSLMELSLIDCSEDPRGVGQGNATHDVESIHFDHSRGNETDKTIV